MFRRTKNLVGNVAKVLSVCDHFGTLCFNPLSANPTKWSNTLNSSAICRRIVSVCLTILRGWRLKG